MSNHTLSPQCRQPNDTHWLIRGLNNHEIYLSLKTCAGDISGLGSRKKKRADLAKRSPRKKIGVEAKKSAYQLPHRGISLESLPHHPSLLYPLSPSLTPHPLLHISSLITGVLFKQHCLFRVTKRWPTGRPCVHILSFKRKLVTVNFPGGPRLHIPPP